MQVTKQPTDHKKLLSRLCHLVALSEAKKIEGVVDSLVTNVVEVDPTHPADDVSKIDEALRIYFGVQIESKDLTASIARIIQAGTLIRDPKSGRLALSPSARARQLQQIADANQLELSVRSEWLESIRSLTPNWNEGIKDEYWNVLRAYLARLFSRHGAQTALIISGQDFSDAELEKSVGDLMDESISQECKTLNAELARAAIQRFFAERSPNRSQYIAQLLDGTFSFYTLFTDDAIQGYLKKAIPRIVVFLDTNFLFGFLNLHDNPQNNVSVELISIIREQQLPFELYYHEESLREMRDTITAIQERLCKNKWSRGLSKAILSTRAYVLTGLELKYHEANAVHEVDPGTFFLKYRHIEKILSENGFKIYRRPQKRDADEIDEPTRELISRYGRFLEDHKKQKPFNAIKHDMILWKAAKALRKTSSDGLDVGALLLSADQRLFFFDWGVLRQTEGIGVVVLPSHLLQLLRPFVPRTADFDQRFADVFSLPEFRSGHGDFSQVTRRVLQFLATVKDVSEETAVAIFADELLLRRLRNIEADEELQQAIESEVMLKNATLIKQHAEATSELDSIRAEAEKSQALLSQREQDLLKKESVVSEHVAALEQERLEKQKQEKMAATIHSDAQKLRSQIDTIAKEKADLTTTLQQTTDRLSDLEKKLAAQEASRKNNIKFLRLIGGIIFTLSGWALIQWQPQIQNWQWLQAHEHKNGLYLAAFLIIPGLGWSIFAWKGRRWVIIAVVLAIVLQLIQIL